VSAGEPIRTERRFGVTATTSPSAARNLFVLRGSETWPDLLDVLEQCCIELETKLINTEAESEAEVLANHKMTKAAWMLFTHMQHKINEAVNTYLSGIANKPIDTGMTDEEMERENIINPLRFPPERNADDYGTN
jgi:hypothetical protein